MNKRILSILLTVALLAGTVVAAHAETGSVTITGGSLAETISNVSFTGVTLTGSDQTTTAAAPVSTWTATDPTGTGAGWNLTITSTDFTSDDLQEVYNNATGGTFTLTYDSIVSAAIAYNASAATVETAIEGLSNVTAATVTGSGTASTPWVIRFVTDSGSGIMTADDGSLTGGTSTVTLATIDISAAEQLFRIQLTEPNIVLVAGNAKPTTSVAALTSIADATLKFASAATGEGMGNYTLSPNFDLALPAEIYAAPYTATITVAIVAGP